MKNFYTYGVPYTRVWRTLRQHGLNTFRLQMVQRLEEGDEARRLNLCRWVIANRQLISFILFTDEVSFTRDGINNNHNSHQWSEKIHIPLWKEILNIDSL